MITINLLPYELRPIKRTPLPYIGGAIAFVAVLAMIVLTYLSARSDVNGASVLLLTHQQEFLALEPVVTEYNTLNARKQLLDKKAKTIEEIVADRLTWSRQLFDFSRLLPDNMWYGAIEVTLDKYTVPQTVTDANGVTTTIHVPRTRQIVTLDGFVRPGEDGQSTVNPLMLSFESDEKFSKMFTLNPVSYDDIIKDGLPVRTFTIPMIVNPEGGSDD
jgi:hypothetical protein